MILLLDNYDSFTFNLEDYFRQLNTNCKVVRNDVSLETIDALDFEALVISPGPETPSKSGHLMEVLDIYHDKVPILGICLGHQAIGQYFGGKVVKALRPMHGKISQIKVVNDVLFKKIPSEFKVVRYNSLVVDLNDEVLEPIAWSTENELMALRHRYLPIWGLQFHPEAVLTEHGLTIIRNWLKGNQLVI